MLPTAMIRPITKFKSLSRRASRRRTCAAELARGFLAARQLHASRRWNGVSQSDGAPGGARPRFGPPRGGTFMQSGLYVSLSGQVALERRLETIASNVANTNTVGYRADGVSFAAELAKAGDQQVAFASSGQSFISRVAGPLTRTGNPLDLAVQGDGWFAIQTPNGIAYTRDGRMQLTESGALQT